MKQLIDDLSPPVKLALAYAPTGVRKKFELLLRFDSRFASVIGTATESMIAQIKIAWWRDALLAPADQRPKGEPLLAALFEVDDPALIDAVLQLADAWELLLSDQNWTITTVENFAKHRGVAVFYGYCALAGLENVPLAVATRWAQDDLRLLFGGRVPQMDVVNAPLPAKRALRPLTILALSVRDVSGPYLLWHALTGR